MQANPVSFGSQAPVSAKKAQNRAPVQIAQSDSVQFSGQQGSQSAKRASGANSILLMLGAGCALCAVGCIGLPIAAVFVARHFAKKIPGLGKLIP